MLLTLVAAGSPAAAQTVLEQHLARLQPCKELTTTQNIVGTSVTIGVDQLDRVTVERATVDLTGDRLQLRIVGGLARRTPSGAVVVGDVGIDVDAAATVDLSTCTVEALTVEATGFHGSFAPVASAVWPAVLQPTLEAEGRKALVDACQDVTGSR